MLNLAAPSLSSVSGVAAAAAGSMGAGKIRSIRQVPRAPSGRTSEPSSEPFWENRTSRSWMSRSLASKARRTADSAALGRVTPSVSMNRLTAL